MVTIIIPSKTEKFLQKTTQDVLAKATGDIEVLVILDGYDLPSAEVVHDPRLRYIRLPQVGYTQKRHGINQAVAEAKGEYVMSVDAHCMFAPGFDEQLVKDHQPTWVQIPRRNRLDAENWSLQTQSDSRPPIDYEYTMYPLKFDPPGLHGFKWDARTLERENTKLDDQMHFQGSCWFMTKEWFHKLGLMQIEGYTGWGQEAEEIGLKTWRAGGRVITNKNTWYAHLHKGAKYGRMYWMSRQSIKDCNDYSYNYWVNENKDFFIGFVERFWPVPGWPADWKKKLWPSS
jgi:glycosyltransferase involved in cell wall biosynthesis